MIRTRNISNRMTRQRKDILNIVAFYEMSEPRRLITRFDITKHVVRDNAIKTQADRSRVGSQYSTVHRRIDDLVALGLLERTENPNDPGDHRSWSYRLTPAGDAAGDDEDS